MPIQVQLPDGSIGEFPDGMADADIERVLKQQFPQQQPQAKPQAAPQPVRSTGSPTKRGIGLGARATLEGVAGVADLLSSPLRAAFELSGSPQETYVGLANRLGDKIGLPRPETPSERINTDIGRALSGSAVTMGAGSLLPVASRANQVLTAQPLAQSIGSATGAAASGIARENGSSPAAQFVAGLTGALAPGVATSSGSGLIRLLTRGGESGRQRVAQTISDFGAVGAKPSVGQATGRWTNQAGESLLAGGPTSSGVMTRFAEKQADDIGSGLGKLADSVYRNASGERAGRQIERGVSLFSRNVNAQKKALYWQADQFIPSDSPVQLSNTWQEVVRLTTPTQGAAATTGAMVSPKIAALRDNIAQDVAANGGVVPYEALKRIRASIGEAISDYSLSPDTPTREFKAIYAALSRDMEAAAQAQGPAAVAAARRANNYTRAAADRLEMLDRVVGKAGGPEKVYESVMSGSRDGGTVLRSVMQSLPVEGQKSITAAVIKRMGLANPGMQNEAGDLFSAQTFLTNWNKVSPEARRALFDRYGPQFSENVDKIARVAANIKNGSKVFANPSGTANRAAAYTYGAALAGSAATGQVPTLAYLVGSGVGANVLARVMTNPKAVAWLAKNTDKPIGSALASLQVMAQTDPDMQGLLDALSKQRNDGKPQ